MQLKYVPLFLLMAASICLAGAVTASAQPTAPAAEASLSANAD